MPAKTKKAPSPKPASDRRRPAQDRSLQRVATVLAAAREALVEVGYARMTMLDIAARAGVTHTSIYHYFKSIEEILAALMQERLTQANVQGNQLLQEAMTAGELIDACLGSWRISFQMYREVPDALPLYAAARAIPRLAEIEQQDYRQLVRFCAAQVRRVLPKLDVSAVIPDLTALVYLSVPMYDLILQQPKTQQAHMQAHLEEMLRLRLETTLMRCVPGLNLRGRER